MSLGEEPLDAFDARDVKVDVTTGGNSAEGTRSAEGRVSDLTEMHKMHSMILYGYILVSVLLSSIQSTSLLYQLVPVPLIINFMLVLQLQCN